MRYNRKFNHFQQVRRDDSFGDSGGGGGAPAATPTSSPSPAASPAPSPSPSSSHSVTPDSGSSNNPPEPKAFRHWSDSDAPPSPAQTESLGKILAKESDPNHTLSFNEIQQLLGYPMKFQQPGQEHEPEPAPATVVPPTTTKVETPAAPVLDPNVAAIVQALQGVVNAPAANAPANPAQPEAPKPYYGGQTNAVQIAPELANAIFNAENPQQATAALNHMVNGIMNRVMEDASTRMFAVAKHIMTQTPQIAQQQYQTQSTTEKFYSKFPELGKSAFRPVVGQIATAIARDRQSKGQSLTDDSFLSAVAEATHKFLEQEMGTSFRPTKIAAAPVPAPAANPNPAPAPQGKFFTPGGSRANGALPNGKDDNYFGNLVI